jgi:hypothetical protein
MNNSAREIGTRVTTPIVNMNLAGVGNCVVIFTLPALAGILVGAKSAVIKKVILNNNGTGNTKVHIGTGAAAAWAAALLPALDSMNGLTDEYGEIDLPNAEAFANMVAYPDAVGGSSIDIQLELLIRG